MAPSPHRAVSETPARSSAVEILRPRTGTTDDTHSIADDVSLVGSFRHSSFAFGPQRPVFLPGSPIPTAAHGIPDTERETILQDEEELLKENLESPRRGGDMETGHAVMDERTALLGMREVEPTWTEAVDAGNLHTTYTLEGKVLLKNSIPLYITFLLQYSLTLSSIFSAGNLGKDELAGVSLGAMTAVITAYAPYQGMGSAWRGERGS